MNDYTRPLTDRRVVDHITTDLAVPDVTPGGLNLVELAPAGSYAEVATQTGANLSGGLTPAASRQMSK